MPNSRSGISWGLTAGVIVSIALTIAPSAAARPSISKDSGPRAYTRSSTSTLTFSSNDPNARIRCRLATEASYANCGSSKTYTDQTEGRYTLFVFAVDQAGNRSVIRTRTWTVDQTAPVAAIDSGPSDPSGSMSPRFTFSAFDAGPSVRFRCRIDDEPMEDCAAPRDYAGIADGGHRFRLRAVDRAGNRSAAIAPWTWTVATPVLSFSSSRHAAGTGPIAITAGDLNGDGDIDLATANYYSDDVSVLLGDGSGGFTAAPGSPLAVGDGPTSVAIGDLDGDGETDLATANLVGATPYGDVSVLLGDGSGAFTTGPGSPIKVGQYPRSVAIDDLDGDGIDDLAVANSSSGSVSVLLGKESGTPVSATGSPFAVGGGPSSIAIADLNGDLDLDLATANDDSDNVSVLLGNGSGGFVASSGSPFWVSGRPFALAIGDLNGDSDADIVTAHAFASSSLTFLFGDGTGSFAPPSGPFVIGSAPYSVAIGDLTGDGEPDLATPNRYSNDVSVTDGDGLGGFTLTGGSPFAAGGSPAAVALTDLNGDGKTDMATADFISNSVTTLLNTTP